MTMKKGPSSNPNQTSISEKKAIYSETWINLYQLNDDVCGHDMLPVEFGHSYIKSLISM